MENYRRILYRKMEGAINERQMMFEYEAFERKIEKWSEERFFYNDQLLYLINEMIESLPTLDNDSHYIAALTHICQLMRRSEKSCDISYGQWINDVIDMEIFSLRRDGLSIKRRKLLKKLRKLFLFTFIHCWYRNEKSKIILLPNSLAVFLMRNNALKLSFRENGDGFFFFLMIPDE